MNTTALSLRARALGERTGTSAAAVAEMIRGSQFVLSEGELEALERRDEILGGWVFSYRFHQATPTAQTAILEEGLSNANPRVREQACDLIGDRQLSHMRGKLTALIADPVPFVAEAARSSDAMLAG